MSRTILALVTLLALPAPAQSTNPNMLNASLTAARRDYAHDADVEVTVDLLNASSHGIDLPAQILSSATLLLDVRDASGNHVPTVPPPVPRADMAHFAPGEHRSSKLRLGMFSPPLPPGDYVVAPASSIATGTTVPFRIVRSTP